MGILSRNRASAERLNSLRALSLFAECSNKQLEFIDSRTDQVTAKAGELLIREGKLNHTFFLVLDGGIQISRGGEAVALRGPGDFFGEISMIDYGVATATVEATKETHLMVMSHQQFRDAVMADDDVLAPVLKAMADRMPDAQLAPPEPGS